MLNYVVDLLLLPWRKAIGQGDEHATDSSEVILEVAHGGGLSGRLVGYPVQISPLRSSTHGVCHHLVPIGLNSPVSLSSRVSYRRCRCSWTDVLVTKWASSPKGRDKHGYSPHKVQSLPNVPASFPSNRMSPPWLACSSLTIRRSLRRISVQSKSTSFRLPAGSIAHLSRSPTCSTPA